MSSGLIGSKIPLPKDILPWVDTWTPRPFELLRDYYMYMQDFISLIDDPKSQVSIDPPFLLVCF